MRKVCAKCGITADYAPRERRCKEVTTRGFGKFARRYYCWGKLAAVADAPTPKAARPPKPSRIERATERLNRAETQRARLRLRLTRLETALHKAEVRVKRWSRELSLTDEQVRQRELAAARAAQVSAVRRRLRKAAGRPDDEPPVFLQPDCRCAPARPGRTGDFSTSDGR